MLEKTELTLPSTIDVSEAVRIESVGTTIGILCCTPSFSHWSLWKSHTVSVTTKVER
jgi:hypothetical protein